MTQTGGFDIDSFVIDLTFACLREAFGEAGILTFELKVTYCNEQNGSAIPFPHGLP